MLCVMLFLSVVYSNPCGCCWIGFTYNGLIYKTINYTFSFAAINVLSNGHGWVGRERFSSTRQLFHYRRPYFLNIVSSFFSTDKFYNIHMFVYYVMFCFIWFDCLFLRVSVNRLYFKIYTFNFVVLLVSIPKYVGDDVWGIHQYRLLNS